MFHGWMFDPDGDQAAADSTRSSITLDTGSSVNPRTARRLVTASYTSMIASYTSMNPCPANRLNRLQKFQQVGIDFILMSSRETIRSTRMVNFLRALESVSENALMLAKVFLRSPSMLHSQNWSSIPCEALAPGRLARH
jgi:hypothetical protein